MNTYIEEWKDVPNFSGVYQVSNFGSVKRLKGFKCRQDRELKPSRNTHGYYVVCLTYKGLKQYWEIHRLVATVFQRPLIENEDAHHKNKLTCCNCNWNIEILDHKKHSEVHNKKKNKGKKFTEEHKKKISEALKGRNVTWANKTAATKKLNGTLTKKDPVTGRFIKS